MKRIMMILSAILPVAVSYAQNLDPTVEVSRVYEGKLIEVHKPVMEMSVPDTLYRFDLDFDYSVFENPYRGAYEFNPYMMDMRPESDLVVPSGFYLRAGAGYTLHPVFDVLWTPELKSAFDVTLHGFHRSYVGGYRGVMGNASFKGYDLLSKAGVDFGYDWQKASVDFGVSYYGLAVKDLWQKRSFNALDADFSVESKTSWSESFMYKVDAGYRYGSDASEYGLTEHGLDLDVRFGPSFGESNRMFFDLGVELNSYSGSLSASAARFYLVPHYIYERGALSLDLGLRLSAAVLSGSFKKNQIVYPDIRMSLSVIPDALRLYLNVGGGESLNSYSSLIDRNHHVSLMYGMGGFKELMKPSMERVSSELGFEGRISGFFSYNIRGGYSNWGNAALDAIWQGDDGRYMPGIGYSSYQRAYAALDWDLTVQNLRFDGTLAYSYSWALKNPSLFAPAALTGDVEAIYNWRKRVFAGVDCLFSTSRHNGNGMTVPWYADLGIYAEYAMNGSLSFWLRGGNLLNMEIQKNLLVAEKGINFTAGVCLNF